MRIALRFAYDGRFQGYARQPEGGTVEDHIIQALRNEGYLEGTWVTGSRTDKGVSAVMNVAAVELDRLHLEGLLPAVQRNLPDGLWITGAARVTADWNPRHARSRTYAYLMPRGQESLLAMHEACQAFLGTHDMRAFARVEDRNPIRTIEACDVDAVGDYWQWTITAPNFLWNQVRRMVSATVDVGQGTATVEDLRIALTSGVAQGKFPKAAAGGLLLAEVRYEPQPRWAVEAGPGGGRRLTEALQHHALQGAFLAGLRASLQ